MQLPCPEHKFIYMQRHSRVTLYTAGHLHTAVPHCSHSRAPIVHTAVPRENNEHGCVYLRCRAVCKLPGCVEGHPWHYAKLFLLLTWCIDVICDILIPLNTLTPNFMRHILILFTTSAEPAYLIGTLHTDISATVIRTIFFSTSAHALLLPSGCLPAWRTRSILKKFSPIFYGRTIPRWKLDPNRWRCLKVCGWVQAMW